MVVASWNSMLILPRCAGGAIWCGRGVGCGGNGVRSNQAPGRKACVPLQPACRMSYQALLRTVQWREQCTQHPATDLREVQRCTLSSKACMQLHQRACRCELGTHGSALWAKHRAVRINTRINTHRQAERVGQSCWHMLLDH